MVRSKVLFVLKVMFRAYTALRRQAFLKSSKPFGFCQDEQRYSRAGGLSFRRSTQHVNLQYAITLIGLFSAIQLCKF